MGTILRGSIWILVPLVAIAAPEDYSRGVLRSQGIILVEAAPKQDIAGYTPWLVKKSLQGQLCRRAEGAD